MKRMISNESGIDAEALRTGSRLNEDLWLEIAQAIQPLRRYPIVIDTRSRFVEQITAKARRMRDAGKLDLLIVDYLQIVNTRKTQDRRQEVEQVSRELKLLSMELDMPVIAVAQLNREGRKGNPIPHKEDLRETGAIEQDADNIFFLWDEFPDEQATFNIVDIHFLCDKQRNGRLGKTMLKYNKKCQLFTGVEA